MLWHGLLHRVIAARIQIFVFALVELQWRYQRKSGGSGEDEKKNMQKSELEKENKEEI